MQPKKLGLPASKVVRYKSYKAVGIGPMFYMSCKWEGVCGSIGKGWLGIGATVGLDRNDT